MLGKLMSTHTTRSDGYEKNSPNQTTVFLEKANQLGNGFVIGVKKGAGNITNIPEEFFKVFENVGDIGSELWQLTTVAYNISDVLTATELKEYISLELETTLKEYSIDFEGGLTKLRNILTSKLDLIRDLINQFKEGNINYFELGKSIGVIIGTVLSLIGIKKIPALLKKLTPILKDFLSGLTGRLRQNKQAKMLSDVMHT